MLNKMFLEALVYSCRNWRSCIQVSWPNGRKITYTCYLVRKMWIFVILASLSYSRGYADLNFCLLRSSPINFDAVEECVQDDSKKNGTRLDYQSLLTEQYALLWLKCALPISSKFCDDYMRDVFMPDIVKFGADISDMMILLLRSWSQKGGIIDAKCNDSFYANKAASCVQFYKPLSSENESERLDFSGDFIGCVLSTVQACDEIPKIYFAISILKYVKYNRLLEDNRIVLKSCLLALQKKSLDECFYGFYDVLQSIVTVKRRIPVSTKKRIVDTNCISIELSKCQKKALRLLQKIAKIFFRVPLDLVNDTKTLRSTGIRQNKIKRGKRGFKNKKAKVKSRKLVKDLDEEYIEEEEDDDPEYYEEEEESDVSEEYDEHETEHLADIIVDHDDHPFTIDPNFTLPDVDYRDIELQVQLEPPYNLPEEVIEHMEDCFSRIPLTKMEYCCPGTTDFMISLINDKPMPDEHAIETQSCSFTCFTIVIKNCSKEDQALMKIIYEGMVDFFTTGDVGGEEPVEGDIVSPDHVPPHMIEHLKHCYRKGLRHKYHQCCPGISTVFSEILMHNYTLSKEVSPRTCNIICIAEIVNFFCDSDAEDTFLKITFGVIADYYKTHPVDKPRNYGNILHIPAAPPYHLEGPVLGYLNGCYKIIPNKKFNKCCNGVTDVFVTLINDHPWPKSEINPHNCNIFCLEDLVGKNCATEAVSPFRKLIYSILAHYSSDKYNKLVPKPEDTAKRRKTSTDNDIVYYLSAPIREYLQQCFTNQLAPKYHSCCPGIAYVFDAILGGRVWPERQITIQHCNFYCVHAIAVSECTPDSTEAFRILLYDITQHYVDESDRLRLTKGQTI